MFQTYIFSNGPSPLLIFRLNWSWIEDLNLPLFTCTELKCISSERSTTVLVRSWKVSHSYDYDICWQKRRSSLKYINKSLLIFQMLMNARSTPMTVTPMQSALTQKAHLLASATWMHITLVTGKHALLIVSRIICFTSVCSFCFTTTLTTVNFYFVEKLSTNIYVAK